MKEITKLIVTERGIGMSRIIQSIIATRFYRKGDKIKVTLEKVEWGEINDKKIKIKR